MEAKQEGVAVLTSGPLPKLHIQMAVLKDAGISSWIRDETIMVVDPFITGGNVLEADLMVSVADLESAYACLPQKKEVVKSSRTNRLHWFSLLFFLFLLPMILAALL